MEFQEPQAKRRRIDIAYTASENTWQPSGPPRQYFQPPSSSSDFAGTGFSNNNGNFNVGGNLYLNNGTTANTASKPTVGRVELLESLRFEQIDSRQLSIKKAHENTCRWFLKDPIYKQWENKAKLRENENLLWIKGKPGAGKSTLMNYLDKQLRGRLRNKEEPCAFISFFFNARGSELERSIEGMYRSLLLQLLEARPELQCVLDPLRSVPNWDVSRLKNLFEEAAEKSSTTVCLIDALDECQENDIRDMVKSFESILRAGSQLHVCFASRHYPYISTQTGLSIVLEEQDQHENDISSYLNTKLEIGHSKQAEEIRLEMREKASGVFMWVVLVVEMLNKEYDKGKIPNLRKRLRQLPGDLHELFHSILIRDNEDRDELLLCIQWVLFAKEPLTPKQLFFAIISGSDAQSLLDYHSDYHSDDISETDMQRYILNSSKGLTEPTKSKKTPTIQFIHESVRDFLLKGNGFNKVFPNLPTNIHGSSHESLRDCCLKYIEMEKGRDFECYKSDIASSKFPFLGYAVKGLLHHANEAAKNGSTQKEFLARFPHATWVKHYNVLEIHKRRRYHPQVSMLYILAEAGTTSLIDAIPNIQSCFDVEESCFGLPILCAVVLNNFDCAQEMLRVQAKRVPGFSYEKFLKLWSPVLAISDGLKPFNNSFKFRFNRSAPRFIEVARFGGELVSIFFLETESVDVNTKDINDYTAMIGAAENGYSHLLKELHQRGADVAAGLSTGQTALHLAVQNCKLVAVQQLINLGADVSVVDAKNQAPLSSLGLYESGMKNDALNIARLLIDNGARVSCTDKNGKTPLHTVSENRHGYELAKLLLDRGAKIAAVDNQGKTPLHVWCSEDYIVRFDVFFEQRSKDKSHGTVPVPEEYLNVGRLLLNRGGDVASINKHGKTPLHYCRTRETAELLLDHNACISATDASGETPLHCAARYYEPYLCQLLLRRGADPTALNMAGEIPIDMIPKYNLKNDGMSIEEWVKWIVDGDSAS